MSKFSNNTSCRVWIEIDAAQEDDNLNMKRAELYTNMIKRLGSTSDISWDCDGREYVLTREGGEFQPLGDHGHWFNLEFFGRPL